MINHELKCFNNPINFKACMNNCKFLERETVRLWFESPNYNNENCNTEEGEYKNISVFKCSKLNKLMYPYSIERKGLPSKYPDTFDVQEAMPKDCDDFKRSDDYFF